MAMALVGFAAVGAQAGAANKSHHGHHSHKSHKPPIKIGFVDPGTSALASSTSVAVPAYQAWVDNVNHHGGINGHKVDLIVVHTDTNPGKAVSVVTQLINQDHVIAIAEISNLDSTFATMVAKAHIPVIGTNISSLLMFTNPDFFAEGQTNDSLPISVAMAAKKIGAKKLGLFYCAESSICKQLVTPEKQVAAKEHTPLVFSAAISASAPNYTAPCLAAKQAGVQALFIADAVSVDLSAAKGCASQGYTPALVADDGAVSKTFATAPGWTNNMISMQPDIPFFVKSKATHAMVKAFKKYEPSLMKNPNYNEEVVESWASGLLFQKAAKLGKLGVKGKPTSKELYKGLYKMHGTTLGGIAPPLSYTKTKPNPIDCWFWMRTKNKKFTTPYGLKPVCAKQ